MHVAVGMEALLSDGSVLAALVATWGVVALVGVALAAAGVPPADRHLSLLLVSLVGSPDVYALGVPESVLGVEWQPWS